MWIHKVICFLTMVTLAIFLIVSNLLKSLGGQAVSAQDIKDKGKAKEMLYLLAGMLAGARQYSRDRGDHLLLSGGRRRVDRFARIDESNARPTGAGEHQANHNSRQRKVCGVSKLFDQ